MSLRILKIKDVRLAEWLRSNPVGDIYSEKTEVIGIKDENGFRRWPLVPVPAPTAG